MDPTALKASAYLKKPLKLAEVLGVARRFCPLPDLARGGQPAGESM